MASRWNQSYTLGVKPGLTYSTLTIGDLLNTAEAEAGDDIAIVSFEEGIRKTYKELLTDVEAFAAGLLELGLKKGDLIGVWTPNSYACVVVHLAVAKTGMILEILNGLTNTDMLSGKENPRKMQSVSEFVRRGLDKKEIVEGITIDVPINPAYRVSELQAVLPITECIAIIIDEHLRTQNFYELLCEVLPGLAESCTTTLDLPTYPSLKHVIKLGNTKIPGTLLLSEVSGMASDTSRKLLKEKELEIQFDDPLYIQFTSGTTGSPKGAVITHFNLVNAAITMRENIADVKQLYNCNPLPLFHTFGCTAGLLIPLSLKGKVVLPSSIFSSEAIIKSIAAEKCNYLMGAPSMFCDILNFPDLKKYDMSSLDIVIIGGSACYKELISKMKLELGVTVLGGYGLSETASGLSVMKRRDVEIYGDVQSSTGRPVAMTEVKVVDKNGLIVPVNTPGEILTRGPCVFQGYWKNDLKTKEAFAPGKWLKTGDLGRLDLNGFLYVDGRIKELVIRGGENIHPRELEELLLTHPEIIEAYVVGVSDKRMIEELCACVKLKPDVTVAQEDIKNFMKGKISHFKIPKYIVFRENFPRTSVGKIQKFILQEEAEKMFGQCSKEE